MKSSPIAQPATDRARLRRFHPSKILIAGGLVAFSLGTLRTILTWLSMLVLSGLCPVEFVNRSDSKINVTSFTFRSGRFYPNAILGSDRYFATWPTLIQNDVPVTAGASRQLVFACGDGENLGAIVIKDGQQLRGGLVERNDHRDFPARFDIGARGRDQDPLPPALQAAYASAGFWTRANLLGYAWPAGSVGGALVAGLGAWWRRLARAKTSAAP